MRGVTSQKTEGTSKHPLCVKQFAPPCKLSGFDFAVRSPAPKVGADGTAILREAGYTEAEIAGLRESRVI